MTKTIARDLLRVVAFIPYVSPIIEKVIDRAWWWADDIFVITPGNMDLDVSHTFAYGDRDNPLNVNVWQSGWEMCEMVLELQYGDYVVDLTPYEVLVPSQTLRPAIRYNFGKALSFIRYFMVNDHEYSTYFRPSSITAVFPYRPHGHYPYAGQDVRGPDYVRRLDNVSVPASNVLNYMYATPEWRRQYASLFDAPRLTNLANMERAEWTGGGQLL